MRISALSQASGVSVPTIKFYLREGLLPAGEATAATQARYDGSHLERLRLVRALVEVAGLSLAEVRDVVRSLDDPPSTWHDVLGVAHVAATRSAPDRTSPDAEPDLTAAREVVRGLGWAVNDQAPALAQLQRAMEAVTDAGLDVSPQRLRRYAEAAHSVAELDVDAVPRDSPAAAARHVVVGTLMYEPLLLALRRLAHEDVSAQRFGAQPAR